MEWSEFSFILKPSSLGGIGVFATHDIAQGTLLVNKGHTTRILKIEDIPLELRQYCIYINDEKCICPERFDRMEIGWFINHSAKPNIALNQNVLDGIDINSGGAMPAYSFYALIDIKAGDEIVIDYNTLKEPENLKEDFYYAP